MWFTSSILEQPPRAGRRRNMAYVVKKRIDSRKFLKVEDEGQRDGEGNGRSTNPRNLLLAAMSAKLEEGNIRAATGILCSRHRNPSRPCRTGIRRTSGRPT